MTPAARDQRRVAEAGNVIPAMLVPLLYGVYPLTIVLVVNPGTSWWIVARAMAVIAAGTGLIFWAMGRRWPNVSRRSIFLATWYFLLTWYAFVLLALHAAGPTLDTTNLPADLVYLVISTAVALAIARPWRHDARRLVAPTFIGLALVGINLPGILRHGTASTTAWQPSAEALTRVPAHSTLGGPPRDIYYIVLDGFGRADTLNRLYGVDLSPAIGHLRAKGFYVPDGARSNYAQTSLSLSSFLNFSYLDGLAAAAGTGSGDRAPTEYAIQHNALMALAQANGYRVIGIGADDLVTQEIDQADVCICERYGLDGFEQAVVGLTPWAGFVNPWTYSSHRAKIRDAFTAVETARSTGPQLVFAHILVPHPPFVFGADGAPRTQGVFTLNDGSQFLGTHAEYVQGYGAQAQFAMRRTLEVIDHLLARPGPRPVIVVHGDHGPGSRLEWEDPAATDIPERMNIFAAYYFPEETGSLYATMTPITGARALARDYLGATLPPLPDRTMFSTWSHPYRFIPVPPSAPSQTR